MYYDGRMREVSYYNYALSASEISDNLANYDT